MYPAFRKFIKIPLQRQCLLLLPGPADASDLEGFLHYLAGAAPPLPTLAPGFAGGGWGAGAGMQIPSL
ncbi:MAG: hypothetical protein D6765_02320 [Bacteroidetes bacterium]|nr:MAG: hypothetical protein D6765_02320 [Bacteroidota bacterium]